MPTITNQPPYRGHSFGGRLWYNLGTARVVRAIFIGMIIYFLVIGGLVLGYAKVQDCLADYSDIQATSAKGRADAAAIDRKLNARYDELSTSERARNRADQQALLGLVKVLIDGRKVGDPTVQQALKTVEITYSDSAKVAKVNDGERKRLDQERAHADKLRADNPLPESPAKSC